MDAETVENMPGLGHIAPDPGEAGRGCCRPAMIGIDTKSLPKVPRRLVSSALVSENYAQVVVSVCMKGLKAQGVMKACGRLHRFSLTPESNAQIVMGSGVAGVQLQGLAKTTDAFFELTLAK